MTQFFQLSHFECGRRESNPYASRHQILSLACLPISTRPRIGLQIYDKLSDLQKKERNQKQIPSLILKLIARLVFTLPSQCHNSNPW